jgi:hypothetical protein
MSSTKEISNNNENSDINDGGALLSLLDIEFDNNGVLINKSIEVKKDVLKNLREIVMVDQLTNNIIQGYSLNFGNKTIPTKTELLTVLNYFYNF